MDKQTSSASDAPETMLEKGHNSTFAADQPEKDQLRVLVVVLTVKVLNKCPAFQKQSLECIAHTKHLVDQVMETLTVTKGVCPDIKCTKRLCKSVVKDLQKEFGGKRKLETAIMSCDPAVDKVIVHCLQAHIRELFDF